MAINFLNTVAVDDNVLFVDTTNDRVGIGTTSPDKLLDVSSDNTPTIRITNTLQSSSNYTIGAFEFFSEDASDPGGARVLSSILCVNNAGSAVPNGELAFYTALGGGSGAAATEKMRITSSGNVGIGTASPSNTLQVGDGTEDSAIAVYFSDGSYTRINGYGLYMSRTASYIRPTTTTTKTLYIGAPSNIWNAISNNANTHYFITGTNEHMRINSAGKVGIGTTSPSEKLDVVGNVKIKDALLSNQENTDIDSAAAEMVAQVAIADYTAAFFDFVIKKTTNVRSGTVYACHDGTNVEFTETSTNDLGDTSDVTLSVDISGTNMRLLATVTSDDWSVKSLIRAI